MQGLLEESFKEHMEFIMRDPVLFGDYKNALEEAEPRLYEDLQDFDSCKALFQEVRPPARLCRCCPASQSSTPTYACTLHVCVYVQ